MKMKNNYVAFRGMSLRHKASRNAEVVYAFQHQQQQHQQQQQKQRLTSRCHAHPSLEVDTSCDATVYGDDATMYQAVVYAWDDDAAFGDAAVVDVVVAAAVDAASALENANMLSQLSTCEKPSLA